MYRLFVLFSSKKLRAVTNSYSVTRIEDLETANEPRGELERDLSSRPLSIVFMLALASVQPLSQDISLGNEAIDNHARLQAVPVMKLTLKIRQNFITPEH